jgi:uncharacterized protein YjbI with pentapeptide repeats
MKTYPLSLLTALCLISISLSLTAKAQNTNGKTIEEITEGTVMIDGTVYAIHRLASFESDNNSIYENGGTLSDDQWQQFLDDLKAGNPMAIAYFRDNMAAWIADPSKVADLTNTLNQVLDNPDDFALNRDIAMDLLEDAFTNYLATDSDSRGAADFSRLDLTKFDLEGMDLRNTGINGGQLADVTNLRNTNLGGLNLAGLDLRGKDIFGTNFTDANLAGANLQGMDLRTSQFDNTNLSGANLAETNLAGTNIRGSDLSGTNLKGANLTGSNLQNSLLNGSDLSDANLTGSNLSGADLSNADLSGTNLSGSNLSGSNLSGTNLAGTNLAGTNLSGTNLTGAQLVAAQNDLRNTNLSGLDLSGANLSGKTINNTNLSGTNLTGTTLPTNITASNLTGADLTGTNLTGRNFLGSNLTNASLANANLTNANLSNVRLVGADTTGATWTNATYNMTQLNGYTRTGNAITAAGGVQIANATATPIPGRTVNAQTGLYEPITNLWGLGSPTGSTAITSPQSGNLTATIAAGWGGFLDNTEFGYYTQNAQGVKTLVPIFGQDASRNEGVFNPNYSANVTIPAGAAFYIKPPASYAENTPTGQRNTFYSADIANSNGQRQNFRIITNPTTGEFSIGTEDLAVNPDFDFQDMIITFIRR